MRTGCADDIRFAGLVGEWNGVAGLNNRDWVVVEAEISVSEHECYGRVGPVLHGKTVVKTDAPEQDVATYY